MRPGSLAVVSLLLSGCLASEPQPSPTSPTSDADHAALPADPKWVPLADAKLPRVEHCAANVGAKFYIIGGFIVPHPVSAPGAAGGAGVIVPTATVEVYDAAANTFTNGPEFPVTLDHCMAVALKDTVYVIHGASSHKLTVGGSQWVKIAAPPHPHGATGVAEAIDGRIYVTGGNGASSQAVDVYDPDNDTWSSLPESANMPTARNHMAGAVVGGRLYAIGGDVGGHSRNTAANEEFDPINGTWTKRADLPVVRGSLHAFAWNDHVVVMGGQNGATNVASFADVHAYDPRTDTWTELAKMTNPRHGFAGGVHDGKIFVFAGAPQQGVSGFAKTDALVPG